MRNLLAMSLCAVALAIGAYGHCAAQSKATDFSGAWTLDKSKTSDLPPTLESCTMTVTQDTQQITIETELKGIGPQGGAGSRRAGRRGDGGGFPGGGSGGVRFPGGIGFPGGGRPGGGGLPGPGPGGGPSKDGGPSKEMMMARALLMAPPKATYTLDGKETVIEMEESEGGQPRGTIVAKAYWKNGGDILELHYTRQFKTPDGDERTVTGKDRWELSDDGQTLTVKRAFETPMGSNEVKIVFNKQ